MLLQQLLRVRILRLYIITTISYYLTGQITFLVLILGVDLLGVVLLQWLVMLVVLEWVGWFCLACLMHWKVQRWNCHGLLLLKPLQYLGQSRRIERQAESLRWNHRHRILRRYTCCTLNVLDQYFFVDSLLLFGILDFFLNFVLELLNIVFFLLVFGVNELELFLQPLLLQLVLRMQFLEVFAFLCHLTNKILLQRLQIVLQNFKLLCVSLLHLLLQESNHSPEFGFLFLELFSLWLQRVALRGLTVVQLVLERLDLFVFVDDFSL